MNEIIHNELILTLKNFKGIGDIVSLFENPNKYGSIISHISFRYDIKDKYNYTKCNVTLTHDKNSLFIANVGYFDTKNFSVNEIVEIIFKYTVKL